MKLSAWRKSLEKSLVLICLSSLIISCNGKDLSTLPIEEIAKEEVFIAKTYHKSYGTVQGSRRLYFTYGVSPLKEPAGVALEPSRYVRYRIKDLVAKWPQIDCEKVQKAIIKQEKELF